MALQLAYETPYGISLPEAYWKINDCMIGQDDEGRYIIQASIAVYANAEARGQEVAPIGGGNMQMTLDMESEEQKNVVAQLYEFLKTQEGFEDAIDC